MVAVVQTSPWLYVIINKFGFDCNVCQEDHFFCTWGQWTMAKTFVFSGLTVHCCSLLFLSNSTIPSKDPDNTRVVWNYQVFRAWCSLYYGSANRFRSSVLSMPDLEAGKIRVNRDALSYLQVKQYAFVYFKTFKGLVVGLDLRIHWRSQSREFFLATSYMDAFRLVEVKLNYIYDVLFTEFLIFYQTTVPVFSCLCMTRYVLYMFWF